MADFIHVESSESVCGPQQMNLRENQSSVPEKSHSGPTREIASLKQSQSPAHCAARGASSILFLDNDRILPCKSGSMENSQADFDVKPPWNKRIPSDIDILASLNEQYGWLPGREHIRPTPETLDRKILQMENVEKFYLSVDDYIWDVVFNEPTQMTHCGKLYRESGSCCEEEKKVFAPNEFPYKLPAGTEHWLMWYSYFPSGGDGEITQDIRKALQDRLQHSNFEFVWYENPKMTVPGIYHVQVFWHEC
eukprot:CAMPEP_0113936654 /NCGR_PEP_ID=MMETSP1339-20121228/3506_1 /TAXON_ID=94617 /ORGANISM="Fibrocapsa japonica" /LENGTH=249 /DNA_ID=CAMNT_0000939185 /DNA_START=1 /DNA_END=750 /DNA_ORIENTATION=- /assembly_acc=CAM_ASM_000762